MGDHSHLDYPYIGFYIAFYIYILSLTTAAESGLFDSVVRALVLCK